MEAQQRVVSLSSEMANLYIQHEEAVSDAKDMREKLFVVIKHAHKDQEEAQKVKDKHDELSRATGQF
jgi:hypothetical protein